MKSKRLAVITTHPIQYHAAWFRRLAAQPNLNIEVLYCHRATPKEQSQAGFGVEFSWDVSLLDGYPHRFLKNVATQPGLAGFWNLDTPEISEIITPGYFDAVMINGWHYKSAWQAMRASWKTKTPVMVRSDSHLHTERTSLKRASKWPIYRWFISKLDACLAVGTWSSDYFLHYGASPERVLLVPHAVDTDFFRAESKRLRSLRATIRRQWGLNELVATFLFVGKFTAKKRPFDFVDAIDLANRQGARIQGLMVGDGPLRAECEQVVRTSDLPVKFSGFLNQSEITAAYVAADALVLPSDGGETWGLVVNEAMACGLPCVVTDQVGCGPDMITAGVNGAIFPMGNTVILAAIMSELASNTAAIPAMRENAAWQAQKYTSAIAAQRTVQALNMVTE